jgi:hypothetical protein
MHRGGTIKKSKGKRRKGERKNNENKMMRKWEGGVKGKGTFG